MSEPLVSKSHRTTGEPASAGASRFEQGGGVEEVDVIDVDVVPEELAAEVLAPDMLVPDDVLARLADEAVVLAVVVLAGDELVASLEDSAVADEAFEAEDIVDVWPLNVFPDVTSSIAPPCAASGSPMSAS